MHSEAEEFVLTVISPGDSFDVNEIMKLYKGKSLREALEDYFEIDPFGDHLDEIIKYKCKKE